jgi:hypothetical protein
MSEDTSYYDYGFKMKKYWICEDCQKDKNNKTETMLTTSHSESLAYEGLLRIIKELSLSEVGTTQSVNFYHAAREAYAKSNSFREYLSDDGRFTVDINKMDRNYRPLWKFTYQIANEEPRIIINMHHDGDYDVCWYPDGEKDMDVNPGFIQAFENKEKENQKDS